MYLYILTTTCNNGCNNLWIDILYLVIGLVVGIIAGFLISKKLVSKQLKENPPIN